MELACVDAVVSSYLAHDPNYPWHVATAVQELCEQPLVVARERHVMRPSERSGSCDQNLRLLGLDCRLG